MDYTYYIIERTYIGLNPGEHPDDDTIIITTEPLLGPDGEELDCGDGYSCGDWHYRAHGAYESEAEARQAVREIFEEVRDRDASGDFFEVYEHEGEVAAFRPGRYAMMSARALGDWAFYSINSDISVDTTDEQIVALVAEYLEEAHACGLAFSESTLEEYMCERRDLLRESTYTKKETT